MATKVYIKMVEPGVTLRAERRDDGDVRWSIVSGGRVTSLETPTWGYGGTIQRKALAIFGEMVRDLHVTRLTKGQ